MERKTRTKETLQKASEHLHYEYWMFSTLARAITSGVFGQGPPNNAVLEAFGIHGRVMAKFIYDVNPQLDDVVAEDFMNNKSKWQENRPSQTEIISYLYGRVGKELAHLTYARIDVSADSKEWPIARIADEINSSFIQFLTMADRDKLAPIWDPLLNSLP